MQRQKDNPADTIATTRHRQLRAAWINTLLCGYIAAQVTIQSVQMRDANVIPVKLAAFGAILLMSICAFCAGVLTIRNRRQSTAVRLQRIATIAGFVLVPTLGASYVAGGYKYPTMQIPILIILLGIAFWLRKSERLYRVRPARSEDATG